MNDRIYSGALTSTYKGSSLKTSPGICEEPFGDTSPTELNNKQNKMWVFLSVTTYRLYVTVHILQF